MTWSLWMNSSKMKPTGQANLVFTVHVHVHNYMPTWHTASYIHVS